MAEPTFDFSKYSVLAVEDENSGIALMGTFLQRLGIKSVVDPTGKYTLQLARSMKPKPDIIFLDLHLPTRTGFDIIKELRADPLLKEVTIIAISALDAYSAIPKCKDAGFDGFIAKPLRVARFVRCLKQILQGESIWDWPDIEEV